LESHFLITDDVVAFVFLAKIPRIFVWEKQCEIEQFGFNVDVFVKVSLAFTWAFPEFDHVLMMSVKKISKIIENENYLFLEHMR